MHRDAEKKLGTEIKSQGRTALEDGATTGPASALKKVQGMEGITSIYVFGLGMRIVEVAILWVKFLGLINKTFSIYISL